MKKNGIIIFIFLIPLFLSTIHVIKLKVKNDGPVKILNKILVPNYTIINAIEQNTSGKELFVKIINKTQEIELILNNNITNCTL